MAHPLIAVMNDETAFLQLMHDLLTGEGYRCIICKEGDKVYPLIKEQQPNLVILDIRMGTPETGWMVLELLRLDPATASIPVIVCSADTVFLRAKADALRDLNCDILEKPFDLDTLLEKVAAMLADANKREGPGGLLGRR
ncbi:MAG TPA: response regulator [Thermomicrobiales bacterium]|nr:response regulator [Thermomicrobiales bacterium]